MRLPLGPDLSALRRSALLAATLRILLSIHESGDIPAGRLHVGGEVVGEAGEDRSSSSTIGDEGTTAWSAWRVREEFRNKHTLPGSRR